MIFTKLSSISSAIFLFSTRAIIFLSDTIKSFVSSFTTPFTAVLTTLFVDILSAVALPILAPNEPLVFCFLSFVGAEHESFDVASDKTSFQF